MKRETLFSVATIFANALFLTASNAGPFFQTSDSQGLVSIEAENLDASTTAPRAIGRILTPDRGPQERRGGRGRSSGGRHSWQRLARR